jgi:peptidoglycan/xylan/chitin deacetylase (PgdA/CDA1 family)
MRSNPLAGRKKAIVRTGLEVLYWSGAHLALRPWLGGVGAILMLHHVRPPRLHAFQPNRLLEVTPAFLDTVLASLCRAQVDIITLDEMQRRLAESDFRRRFVCLTFDDGYRDNAQYALPILRRYDAPFTVYIPTSFPDRLGELWWAALEAVIAAQSRIVLTMDGKDRYFECGEAEEKCALFDAVYWWLRGLDSEEDLRVAVRDLAARYSVDIAALCGELCMTWGEIEELAKDPLVTIGAHTVNHVMLKKTSDAAARNEMAQSAAVIEAALGSRPRHFAYPVGDPTAAGPRDFRLAAELGFATAVTTRPGVLFPEHRDHLTALPRISLNGEYQQLRYAKALMSGAPTALWNRFRRVNSA